MKNFSNTEKQGFFSKFIKNSQLKNSVKSQETFGVRSCEKEAGEYAFIYDKNILKIIF